MQQAPTEPTTPDSDIPDDRTPMPIDPTEGRPDMNMPGADHPKPAPDREDELPQRLGERIQDGPSGGIVTGEPDLLPNVEVPEAQM